MKEMPCLVFLSQNFQVSYGTRKTTTTNSKKFRGQAAGSFVTAIFFKPPGYVYAAPYAVPCKVLEVVNHPLSPHSYPCGPARLLITQIRSPSSSLDSSELQHSNSWAALGESHFSPFFFPPWAEALLSTCLQAVLWQPVNSSFFCLFHPRQNRSSTCKSSLRGRYFLWQSLV